MIRHIVLFKFKPGVTDEEKNGLVRDLLDLKQNTGMVRDIEVERDVGRKRNSYDLALDSLFDSMDNLNAYAVHPAHMAVLDSVKRLCETTVKVDYETGNKRS